MKESYLPYVYFTIFAKQMHLILILPEYKERSSIGPN